MSDIPNQDGLRIKGILLGNIKYDQLFDSKEEHDKWVKDQNDRWKRVHSFEVPL